MLVPSEAVIVVGPVPKSGTMNVTTNVPLESVFARGLVTSVPASLVIVILCDVTKLNPCIDTAVPAEPLDCERKIDGDSLKNEVDAVPEALSVTVTV